MEIIENIKIKENSSEALSTGALQAINEIKEFVEFNELRISGNIKIESRPLTSKKKTLRIKLDEMTLNQRKKFKRIINNFLIKKSVKSANIFLHFLYKKILLSENRISVSYPVKHLQIAAARKNYVVARKIMLEVYREYKDEKGGYYKLRLAKNQKF